MSLVTRCPGCATLFRVVPDQIRIAGGWVRCGHCGDVFEAAAHMLPYEQSVQATSGLPPAPASAPTPAPAPAPATDSAQRPPAQPQPTPAPVQREAVTAPARPTPPPATDLGAAARAWQQRSAKPEAGSDPTPEPVTNKPAPDDAHERQAAARPARGDEEEGEVTRKDPDDRGEQDVEDDQDDDRAGPPSMFIARTQRRRGFWSSRAGRGLLWTVLPLLLLALLLQAALSERDWLAARAPQLAPALGTLCAPLDCRVQPYRQLDAIDLDSSPNLIRLGADSFRLGITLRNTADWPVASPALELTLTDAQERPLLRRVLTPADLGAPPALAARDEFDGVIALTVGGAVSPGAIAGYRLAKFYP